VKSAERREKPERDDEDFRKTLLVHGRIIGTSLGQSNRKSLLLIKEWTIKKLCRTAVS
jgi:hypothetical protein